MRYKNAKVNQAEQKERRKSLRNNATPAEAILWRALKGKSAAGYKFRRQQGIGPYILDFYCPHLKLCIELDGSSHEYKAEYDANRSTYLQSLSIRVIRFTNEQVWASVNDVVAEIIRIGNELEAKMRNR